MNVNNLYYLSSQTNNLKTIKWNNVTKNWLAVPVRCSDYWNKSKCFQSVWGAVDMILVVLPWKWKDFKHDYNMRDKRKGDVIGGAGGKRILDTFQPGRIRWAFFFHQCHLSSCFVNSRIHNSVGQCDECDLQKGEIQMLTSYWSAQV